MADYPERYRDRYVPFEVMTWDIRRAGRSWSADEFDKSYFAMPEKMEAVDGKLYGSDEERLKVLAALLENVGIDRAVRLGDPSLWKAAVAELP
jgi:hypothetical protein